MNAVIQAVNPLANQIIASVLNSVWQGAAMALMVWVLLRVLKRLNAATRYAIWCGSLFSVVALTCLGVAHGLHNRRPGHVEPAKSAAVGFVMPASGLVEASAINELNVQPAPKTRSVRSRVCLLPPRQY